MVVKEFIVKKLFGRYDYHINFEIKEKVTIIHAPNGRGKTTILKLIAAIVEGDLSYIHDIPFELIRLIMDNGDQIIFTKESSFLTFSEKLFDLSVYHGFNLDGLDPIPLNLTVEIIQGRTSYSAKYSTYIDPVTLNYLVKNRLIHFGKRIFDKKSFTELIDSMFSSLNRDTRDTELDIFTFMDVSSLGKLNYDIRLGKEPLFITGDSMSQNISTSQYIKARKTYDQINIIFEKQKIHFISADRLFYSNKLMKEADFAYKNIELYQDKVQTYAKELIVLISRTRDEYSKISESIDRNFPNKVFSLFESGNNLSYTKQSIEIIQRKYELLMKSRNNLASLGLLDQVGQDISYEIESEKNQELYKKVLNLYIDDNLEKLKVFNTISDKLELFRDIINMNEGFNDKQLRFNRTDGFEFRYKLDNSEDSSISRHIPLSKLSSGEKNRLVLFYELIFKSDKSSIILIDEPEISLHISWQEEYIKEILKVCKKNNTQAIIATHSPSIVNEHWDLLRGLED